MDCAPRCKEELGKPHFYIARYPDITGLPPAMTDHELNKRSPIPPHVVNEVFSKYKHRCAICGATTPLQLAHIIPISRGGETSADNLMLLCANCHLTMDRQPREIEFVTFLAEVLSHHPDYTDVRTEVLLGRPDRLQADLVVQRIRPKPESRLVIECKTTAAFGSNGIADVVQQLLTYVRHLPSSQPVFAIPASLRPRDADVVRAAGIELWDLPTLTKLFKTQLSSAPVSFYAALLQASMASAEVPSPELSLIGKLKACRPGKEDWLVYQSLIGNILETLFFPALAKPIAEHSDKAKANRRDFIMPNYAEKGFWAFLRDKYQADYVVVDAKNYSRRASKSDVLQIANYLKPHGAGMFGLILSRAGGDAYGCEHTVREQWIIHRKLILILDEEDVRAMLTAKSERRAPEEVLAQKLESFRLSM